MVISKPKTKPAAKPYTLATTVKIAEGEGLFRFKVTRQASNGYSVQTGAFSEYGNVLKEAAKLQDQFDEPMIVHIARIQTRTNRTVTDSINQNRST